MPVREEETPICWDVVEFAMSQLNIEVNRPKISLEEKTVVPAVVAGEVVSLVGTAIPVVEQKKKSNTDQFSARKSGVNHLNLIQIKGKVAHAFQPHLVQEGRRSRAVVFIPLQDDPLASIELNRILLMANKKG